MSLQDIKMQELCQQKQGKLYLSSYLQKINGQKKGHAGMCMAFFNISLKVIIQKHHRLQH